MKKYINQKRKAIHDDIIEGLINKFRYFTLYQICNKTGHVESFKNYNINRRANNLHHLNIIVILARELKSWWI